MDIEPSQRIPVCSEDAMGLWTLPRRSYSENTWVRHTGQSVRTIADLSPIEYDRPKSVTPILGSPEFNVLVGGLI